MAVTSPLFNVLWDEYILWSLLVGVITFGWLYHHSFAYRSTDGEKVANVDDLKVGVFPKHNDDLRLEVAWTVLPFLLIMVILYFFMLRPQAKKQKDKELMIANLSKGDKVITIGGIVGTINGFKEKGKLVTVKVDSNTILTFNKSSIAGLFGKTSEEDLR